MGVRMRSPSRYRTHHAPPLTPLSHIIQRLPLRNISWRSRTGERYHTIDTLEVTVTHLSFHSS
jgi:hypothetical protein